MRQFSKVQPHQQLPSSPASWSLVLIVCGIAALLLILLPMSAFLAGSLLLRPSRPDMLASAATAGDVARVRQLLDKGMGVNTQDGWAGTPIMYASVGGNREVVRLLVERGADFQAPQRLGRTPLMWAAKNDHKEVVEYLLSQGAATHVQDQDGKTALELAKQEGHEEVVRLLRKAAPAKTQK